MPGIWGSLYVSFASSSKTIRMGLRSKLQDENIVTALVEPELFSFPLKASRHADPKIIEISVMLDLSMV